MGMYTTLYPKWQLHTTITVAVGGNSTAILPWQQYGWWKDVKKNKQTKNIKYTCAYLYITS